MEVQNNFIKNSFLNFLKYIFICFVLSLLALAIKKYVMGLLISVAPSRISNSFFTLYEVHNTGAAFNLFSNYSNVIASASIIVIIILACIVLFTNIKKSLINISAMASLTAGIMLNMIERIQQGYVIDYIHCNFIPNFPVFNVPDIYIVLGALCLIISVLRRK